MMTTKCEGCGQYIPSREMVLSDGRARFHFEPLSEFGPEVSYWLCGDCADKERRTAPTEQEPS